MSTSTETEIAGFLSKYTPEMPLAIGYSVRSIRPISPGTLEEADVRALLGAAMAPCASAFASPARLQTIVKSVSAKQRSRRPAL